MSEVAQSWVYRPLILNENQAVYVGQLQQLQIKQPEADGGPDPLLYSLCVINEIHGSSQQHGEHCCSSSVSAPLC